MGAYAAAPLEIRVAAKMVPFATLKKRHKIARGGRGSAKSQSIARILIGRATSRRTRWLCCRETQKSIKESTKKLLENAIHELGLDYAFNIQEQVIHGPHGSEFSFTGLRKQTAESLKSYEDFDGAWVAEAQSIDADSANKLIPTIRKPGSEIWWDYNQTLPDDFIHQMAERAIRDEDDDVLVVDINYVDNPWFPAELERERKRLLGVSQDLHDHIYGGKLRSVSGVLFKRRWFKYWDKLPENLGRAYMAGDYAGAPDPEQPEADPDYVSLGCAKLDHAENLYFIDWWSEQADADVWIPAGSKMAKTHDVLIWYEEKGVVLRSQDSAIAKALRQEGCKTYRHTIASASSKAERALGFAVLASRGQVYFPNPTKPGNEWVERVINQLCSFTGQQGKKDDDVDVCSLLARGLDLMIAPPEATDDRPKPVVPFSKQHIEATDRMESDEAARRKRHYR